MSAQRQVHVYDTCAQAVTRLVPRTPGRLQMFVCGPTVYDDSHLGHAKTYTQFDLIARYLRFAGYELTYIQNITDIDDRIIKRASERGVEPADLAAEYEALHLEDMRALGNDSVDAYLRAHDHIPEVISQVERLLASGHAYRIGDGIYFHVASFRDYGRLSGRHSVWPDDAVSRIDENPEKRSPADFCLWKFRAGNDPWWEAPLGQGRPGWHIEDTAITERYLGASYDIHGGGVDLVFPHHEAEIAQMESLSDSGRLAAYWLHTGFLTIATEKMSKSLGNSLTVRGALQTYDPRVLRLYFLRHHYRRAVEYSDGVVTSTARGLARLDAFVRSVDPGADDEHHAAQVADARTAMLEAMDDDFDSPRALGVLFELVRDLNRRGGSGRRVMGLLADINTIFGFLDLHHVASEEDARIAELVERRTALRAGGRFAEADEVRRALATMDVVVEDHPDGTLWHRRARGQE